MMLDGMNSPTASTALKPISVTSGAPSMPAASHTAYAAATNDDQNA